MLNYLLKRVFYGLITIWIIATVTFLLLHMLPGNPFETGKAIPPEIKALLFEKYHLNDPLWMQYGYYMRDLLTGNFGESMLIRGRTVSDIILQHFPYSLLLGTLAIIFSLIVGLSLGVVAGFHRGKKYDTLAMMIAIIGVSVPSFVIAGFLQYGVIQFASWTGITLLPVGGYDGLISFILPSIALGLLPVAIFARMMRASIIDVLGQDYIRTARAKGVSTTALVMRHCLRNAIMPIVSYLGVLIAGVITGSFVIENVFTIPGLGQFYVQSIYSNDYTVVLGVTLFYAIILVFLIIVSDLLYTLIDPRVRLTGKEE